MKRKKKSAQARLNFAKQNLSGQEIQDEIFRKMPASKKLKLASDLTMFCLKLNRLNGNNKSGKTSLKNRSGLRRA